MCTARNATTSSDRLRCSIAVANRGTCGAPARLCAVMPSTRLAVSRTSDTAPVPRARYQSSLFVTSMRSLGRPLACRDDGARRADEAGRQRASIEPVDGGFALHDAGGRRHVRIDAGRGRHADRAPDRERRCAGRRIDDVMHRAVAAPPDPDRRARGRQASLRDRDRLAVGVRCRSVVIGDAYAPSPIGGGPEMLMSPPRLTSTPPATVAAAVAARSAASALAVAPRSSDPVSGIRTRARPVSSSISRQ